MDFKVDALDRTYWMDSTKTLDFWDGIIQDMTGLAFACASVHWEDLGINRSLTHVGSARSYHRKAI